MQSDGVETRCLRVKIKVIEIEWDVKTSGDSAQVGTIWRGVKGDAGELLQIDRVEMQCLMKDMSIVHIEWDVKTSGNSTHMARIWRGVKGDVGELL